MKLVSKFCCAGAAAVLALPALAGAAPPPPVEARASLDRTAIWVADRVTYTIELTCRNGADVLDDDLSRDKLKLDGLDLVSTETSQEAAPGGAVVHRYRYVLTTYHVDNPSPSIGALTVRYYVKRPGQRLQDAAPAGEITIPPATIAYRSTLPDTGEGVGLRSDRDAAPRAAVYAAAQPIGFGLVLASIVPVALWGVAVARGRRPEKRKSARQVRHEEHESLEAVRAIDLTSPDGRREAFTRMEALVRRHLHEVCGLPGTSLTPDEVTQAAAAPPRGQVPAETVAALLATCELGRYAPLQAVPSAQACREALDQAEQVLASR